MAETFHKSDLEQLRPLGLLEQYSAVRSHLGIYLNVGVTVNYRRQSSESLKPVLFRALAVVISKHPILSAIPVNVDTTSPQFVRLPHILLQKTVTFRKKHGYSQPEETGPYLDKLLEEQHNRPFGYETPLLPFWRLCVVEDPADASRFTLAFIFHHSIADTQSALVFHEDLEYALSHPTQTRSTDIVSTPSMDLLPPLEELLDLPTSPEFLRQQQSYCAPSAETWTAAPQNVPVRSRFASLWLSSSTTQALLRIAKEEKSSITALLHALLAASLFHILPPTYTTLNADCAVSLRRWLPPPITPSSIGCFVGSFTQTYSRGPFSWCEARRTKATIDQAVESKGADMPVGFLRHVPDMHRWFGQKLGRQRLSAFELSNVGKLGPLKRGGHYRIESMLFSQSASACSGAIKVSGVTGRDERLALGFSWQEGVVDDGTVERLVAKLLEEIEEIVANC